MEQKKQCKNCKYNEQGICCGGGNLYGYGNKITDNTKKCEAWSANIEYFTYEMNNAPRFLREAYNEFSSKFDAYISNKSLTINFFDAVKQIYGISMVDIAVILDVSFGVVYRAKTKGFAKKRIEQFSKGLFLDKKFLLNTTTSDFDNLKESSEIFWSQPDITKTIESIPTWKGELAAIISANLKCPIHLAKKFARIDKMFWESGISLDKYTESEKNLIEYITTHAPKDKRVVKIDYSLDLACLPHMNISLFDKKKA